MDAMGTRQSARGVLCLAKRKPRCSQADDVAAIRRVPGVARQVTTRVVDGIEVETARLLLSMVTTGRGRGMKESHDVGLTKQEARSRWCWPARMTAGRSQ